ncbi:serine hydrolase domain-containing protein [Dethiobacter alkaliphilus]|nr:serine hydrolase domain-containing protein [Dethiobacter alkaliphilus]
MEERVNESLLENVVNNMARNRNVLGAVLCVEKGDGSFSWTGGAGNMQEGHRYFITSVTKLYTTAMILRLRAEGLLRLDDKLSKFFSDEILDGLHHYNGIDYSREITVTHLLANTSGLPDYLSYKVNGNTADSELFNKGIDQSWPLEKVLEATKSLRPKFIPGQKGKVLYSNTNYRLLGSVIEKIAGMRIDAVFQKYIFDELNLIDTYAYSNVKDNTPAPMYFQLQAIQIPNCMASVTAEGGIVSTAKETMAVLKGFFNGQFFPASYLEELKKWNFILFPYQFHFGIGLEKLWVPRLLSPVKPINEILGFWGSSGAFAFFNPDKDLYFTGTVNQSNGLGHKAAFKAMLKIIKSA